MKPKIVVVSLAMSLLASFAHAQGTFLYDQQSSDENSVMEGGTGIAALAQSFTPSFSAVGFIRLYLYDGNLIDGLGATVYVNLRSDSITGPILGSTVPVTVPVNFIGPANFLFAVPVTVTPGKSYYFEAQAQPGSGGFGLNASSYNYAGGTAFFQGVASPNDLWFREGIIVPEPSAAMLVLLGGTGVLAVRCRRKHFRPRDKRFA